MGSSTSNQPAAAKKQQKQSHDEELPSSNSTSHDSPASSKAEENCNAPLLARKRGGGGFSFSGNSRTCAFLHSTWANVRTSLGGGSSARDYTSISSDQERFDGLAMPRSDTSRFMCRSRKENQSAQGGSSLSENWKSILTPLMYVTGNKRRLDKHTVQVMELQAITAGHNDLKDIENVESFVHRITGSSRGLVHPHSSFSRVWSSVVAIVVLCACIEAPFYAFFTPFNDDGRITSASEVIHLLYRLLVDIVFVLDIFVRMRTGYPKLGAVVMDKDLIERHYAAHGLVYDVIAALPILGFPVTIAFNFLCMYGACPSAALRYVLSYVRLLQLFKIKSAYTTLNIITESLADKTSTLVVSIGELLIFFIVLTHWFTCAWFIVQVYPINFSVTDPTTGELVPTPDIYDSWLGSNAANNGNDDLIHIVLQSWENGNASLSETFIIYLNCFYWASSANDAYTTMNTSEKFVAILAQIFIENGFMAFILASIISSLDDFSRGRRKYSIYRSKIDSVNDFMRNESFPSDVIDSVREYYKYVWLPQQIDFTETQLHEELPHYLRTEVMSLITRKVLLTSKFMSDYFKDGDMGNLMRTGTKVKSGQSSRIGSSKSKWIKLISENLVPKFFIAQQYVMRQGDVGTELYIIKQGKCVVEIDLEDGTTKEVAERGPGDYVGDIALLGLNTTRTASIRTITNSIIFELKQEDMQKVWEIDPQLKMYMEAVARKQFSRTKSQSKKDIKPPEPEENKEDSSESPAFPRTASEKQYAREIEALADD
jgi:CRP-like cAMP-binding protein